MDMEVAGLLQHLHGPGGNRSPLASLWTTEATTHPEDLDRPREASKHPQHPYRLRGMVGHPQHPHMLWGSQGHPASLCCSETGHHPQHPHHLGTRVETRGN